MELWTQVACTISLCVESQEGNRAEGLVTCVWLHLGGCTIRSNWGRVTQGLQGRAHLNT